MQSTDDSVLLRQYAGNNSDAAFAALVTRHINLVYSVALRQVGNPHNAEEITQAVFIILAKKARELRHGKALSSWLFRVTRLTANNFVRSEIRRQRREQEACMQTILNESGNEAWPSIAPLLDTAVAGLNEKDRRAILLRFYEGRNLGEVGTALGASEDAAKKRVNRAVEKLRVFFTKRGIVLPAAVLTVAISANSVQAAPMVLAKSITAVAMTKGVAASGSTLTLIKTTLKLMAWTNTKTAVVVGAVIILAAGTITMLVHHPQLPKPQSVAASQTEFPKSSWHFAGYADPESAYLSCMWAFKNGDLHTMLASVSPEVIEKLEGKPLVTDKEMADVASITSYRIIDKQSVSDSEAVLQIETDRNGTSLNGTHRAKLYFQRVGGEWKYDRP